MWHPGSGRIGVASRVLGYLAIGIVIGPSGSDSWEARGQGLFYSLRPFKGSYPFCASDFKGLFEGFYPFV